MFLFSKNYLLFLFLLLGSLYISAQERILNFDVQVIVNKDRSINVTEIITVYATGHQIKRGITRNFPSYRNMNGRSVKMDYQILMIRKDGELEPHFEETSDRGYTIYIGNKNVFLKEGEYTYQIEYRVPNQVGLFDEYDEIYWNAIGTDVVFNVEKASCLVVLPYGAALEQEAAYVGFRGENKKDFTLSNKGDNLLYSTTRSLKPREAFTIAVGFEKGVVDQAGLFERYGTLIIIFLGLLFLFPYYIYTWVVYGKDPASPASYPIFNSPNELSAASMNYILNEKYKRKSFTASVIALAIKGFLKIEETETPGIFTTSKSFDLIKVKEADESLNREEERLFNTLFSSSRNVVSIDGQYHSYVESAYQVHQGNLDKHHHSFVNKGNNRHLLWLPILSSIAIAFLSFFIFEKNPYADGINMMAIFAFGAIALISILLYTYLIKQPTVEKLELQSRIKGFQMYLEMAEKDRLNLLNPPELTPQHFEDVLPFAFALGVEHKWSERFKTILEAAQYRPDWNNSANTYYFSNHFGNSFSNNLIGSATKPPESGGGGGGSFGGGFSGGGGGGGGVGGW